MDASCFITDNSLDDRDEGLALFDDVRTELRSVDRADVLRRVDRSGRNEQDLTGLQRYRRLALDLVLQRPLDDVDDLLAEMRVPGEGHPGIEVHAHLDLLAPGNAHLVPPELLSPCSGLLTLRDV